MIDITKIFDSLIDQFGVVDIADSELKHLCLDDASIKSAYKEWCASQMLTQRNGFITYFNEQLDSEDLRWNALDDEVESYDF